MLLATMHFQGVFHALLEESLEPTIFFQDWDRRMVVGRVRGDMQLFRNEYRLSPFGKIGL